MLARLEQSAAQLSADDLKRTKHALMVLPKATSLDALGGVPSVEALAAALARRGKKFAELAQAPLATDLPHGTLASWVMLDPSRPVFQRQTILRRACRRCWPKSPARSRSPYSGRRVSAAGQQSSRSTPHG